MIRTLARRRTVVIELLIKKESVSLFEFGKDFCQSYLTEATILPGINSYNPLLTVSTSGNSGMLSIVASILMRIWTQLEAFSERKTLQSRMK